jgi:hypothetical protein
MAKRLNKRQVAELAALVAAPALTNAVQLERNDEPLPPPTDSPERTATELAAQLPEQAPKGPVLRVKQGLTLRGGRGEWYKLLCQYDGKPVADFVAQGKAKPASHYTARSTKCGQAKTPESRLSWFKRAGIVTIG